MTPINQSTESGALAAFVSQANSDPVIDYLSIQGVSTKHIEQIVSKYRTVAVFKNMAVSEHARGQGTGRQLLQQALNSANQHAVDACVLVADITEHNAFDLVAWYERSGFVVTGQADGNPVMIRECL